MQITCPNCKKQYTINEARLPSGVKTARCKACGQSMPLKKTSAKASTKSKSILKLVCQCGKKYKISRDKIPPKAVAVKCKACGHNIQLPPIAAVETADDHLGPDANIEETPPSNPDLMSEKTPPPVSRPRKKKWLVAAVACVLLAAVVGTLAHLDMIKVDWLNRFIAGSAEKSAESSQLLDKEPFLVLNLNLPLILDALENPLAPGKKSVRAQMILSMVKSLALSQLELYLYAAPNNQVLPVILAHGGSREKLETVFNRQEWFKEYFIPRSGGRYLLNKEAIGDADQYQLPREPYQVTLLDDGAALAPVSFSAAITENPHLFSNSRVAKFVQTIAKQPDLAAIAISIPENNLPGWEKIIQDHPAVQINPQTEMIAGLGSAIISQLSGSLKPVEVLALGFRFSGQNERALSYVQQFRPGVDGEKIYRQLAAGNPADAEITGIIGNLLELFQDQRYRHALDFKDNRLALEFKWPKKEDDAFLTALTAATIGQLFAGSMDMSPTPGKVETRYAAEPYVVTTVDTGQLKAKIPQMIKDSLFPGQYWNHGDKPRMTLDLDTIDFPNAALAEMTYKVKSIKSPDGRDVLRLEESQFKPRIQPGSLFPGNISLNVKEGTPPDDLAKAVIDFHLTVPVALEVVSFSAEDQPGSAKEAAGIRVTLGRLEKDVAQAGSSGGKAMRLVAYDHTGQALASKESMSTPSSISTRFEGSISSLKVVVTRKILDFPFEIEVDLNQGKELVLSREPEIPVRTRYNPHPIPTHVNLTPGDLKNLAVVWREGQEGSWNDSLSIKLPQGPISGHAVWEVHFFRHNQPRLLSGSSVHNPKDFSFTLDKGELKQASAAFGKVQLNLHTDITRLVFAQINSSQPAPQTLPSGDRVAVEFNKNEIAYSAGNAEVIQIMAYDSRSKRLKQDQYSRGKGGKRVIYFWGVPAIVEMDVSTKTIEELIPFDIRKRPLDETAYQAFKQTIENQREVVGTIKSIDRARRKDRSYYGDDLAGLYYLYHDPQKEPRKLISQAIAHSDPAGQERFGYQLRPHKGYYFTVLAGVETNGVKKDYNRRFKPSRFTWQKGTISTTTLTRHPDLVAIPEDNSQPTFFLQWGQVFMKSLNGEKLKYLPDGFYNKGWVEAKYIDD